MSYLRLENIFSVAFKRLRVIMTMMNIETYALQTLKGGSRKMSAVTNRNPNLALPLTERNIGAGNITVQNPSLNDVTVRNTVAEDFTNFSEGTILLGKYVVTDRLPVTSGEANIYICEYDDEEYIAKIYNRKDAVKSEIVEKLKALDSPHVAKIYDTGEY